jgi:hypothetical protein
MVHSSGALPPLPARLAALFGFFPAALVREALASPRCATPCRERLRPRRLILWLVIALGLLGRWSIPAAWQWLLGGDGPATPPDDSALAQARHRLGIAPFAYLARRVVRFLADPRTHADAFYKGLRLIGFDGTCLSLADTEANARVFGYATNQHGSAGFPQLRLLALCELGTHALVHWLIKPLRTSENVMADVLVRFLEAGQLLLLDANFYSFRLWQAARGRGAHLLARVQTGPLLTPLRRLSDGSSLTKIYATTADRLADRRGTWVRVIAYTHNDPHRVGCRKKARLITSLLDPIAHPALELIELYHERWEQELAFDELKTHLNDRKVDVRSKTPAGVVQEVYGLLLAHYVLRALMSEAAVAAGVPARTLSFTSTLRVVLIRLPEAPRSEATGLAQWYAALLAAVAAQRLRPRQGRINARVIKGGRSKFPRKAKGQRGHRVKPFREHVLIT